MSGNAWLISMGVYEWKLMCGRATEVDESLAENQPSWILDASSFRIDVGMEFKGQVVFEDSWRKGGSILGRLAP